MSIDIPPSSDHKSIHILRSERNAFAFLWILCLAVSIAVFLIGANTVAHSNDWVMSHGDPEDIGKPAYIWALYDSGLIKLVARTIVGGAVTYIAFLTFILGAPILRAIHSKTLGWERSATLAGISLLIFGVFSCVFLFIYGSLFALLFY